MQCPCGNKLLYVGVGYLCFTCQRLIRKAEAVEANVIPLVTETKVVDLREWQKRRAK